MEEVEEEEARSWLDKGIGHERSLYTVPHRPSFLHPPNIKTDLHPLTLCQKKTSKKGEKNVCFCMSFWMDLGLGRKKGEEMSPVMLTVFMVNIGL